MFDFQALKQANKKMGQASERRSGRSLSHYERALRMLIRFHQTKDQRIIERALDELHLSLKTHSNQAEPCAIIAYLFYGMERYSEASRYFLRARQNNPNLPLVQKLQQLMDEGKPLQHKEVSNKDEEIFEKLQQYMHKFIQKITALSWSPLEPCLQRTALQEQYSFFTECKVESIFLNQDLDYAGKFLDVSHLRLHLETYLKKMAQFNQWIIFSEEALNMQEDIQQRQQSLNQALQEGRQNTDIQALELRVEDELELCDAYADHLDIWDEAGYKVSELIACYEAWVQVILQAQSFLDNAL